MTNCYFIVLGGKLCIVNQNLKKLFQLEYTLIVAAGNLVVAVIVKTCIGLLLMVI